MLSLPDISSRKPVTTSVLLCLLYKPQPPPSLDSIRFAQLPQLMGLDLRHLTSFYPPFTPSPVATPNLIIHSVEARPAAANKGLQSHTDTN